MSTKFNKGSRVKVVAFIPSGEVKALRMDEDGNVFCLLEWQQGDIIHSRWFSEDVLVED
jgi:hypothetical protein